LVKKGYDEAFGEIKQLHDREVFKPVHVSELTQQERKYAMESLIFLLRKETEESEHETAQTVARNENTSTKKIQQVQQ
jgi:hypothetical protein